MKVLCTLSLLATLLTASANAASYVCNGKGLRQHGQMEGSVRLYFNFWQNGSVYFL